ncbi:MAG TPA: hypothetical protein VK668_19450 [Mucilaginibacter sp.]|nr:hypothetical protein [Mucilaginibacter sp.]
MNFERVFDNGKPFKSLHQLEQVKIGGYVYYLTNGRNEFQPKDLAELFKNYNIDGPANISRELSKALKERPRDVIKHNDNYALERSYINKMNALHQIDYSKDTFLKMNNLLVELKDINQKQFLEDALKCFGAKIYRPTIIMTWLVVLDVLYDKVINSKLNEFNLALLKQNKKTIITIKSDFEDIKESTFIEVLRSASIISKEQKKILDEKLTIRNSASHPNQTSFKESKVVSFIEELLYDVVDKLN